MKRQVRFCYHVPLSIQNKAGMPENFIVLLKAIQSDTQTQGEVIKGASVIIDTVLFVEEIDARAAVITNRLPVRREIDKMKSLQKTTAEDLLLPYSTTAYRLVKALNLFGRISRDQYRLTVKYMDEVRSHGLKVEEENDAISTIEQILLNGALDTKKIRQQLKEFDAYEKSSKKAASEGYDSFI